MKKILVAVDGSMAPIHAARLAFVPAEPARGAQILRRHLKLTKRPLEGNEMINTPHIVWRNMARSEALEARVLEGVEELESLFVRVTACRVVLEAPHRHAHGAHFVVKIELTVPGKVLVVARDPDKNATAEDAYAAVGEAFDAMRRQLVDYAQVRRGEVKQHVA